MNDFLEWTGLVFAIVLGIVFLGNDCENAHKLGARVGRWADQDLPVMKDGGR